MRYREKIYRKYLSIIISMLFISIIIGGLVGGANKNLGNTIYVDDDNIDGPWDGSIEHPYRYIQQAVDNATDGATIFVYNGVYKENLEINISINLVGEDRNNTIIDGDGEGTVVSVYSPINLHGFTIQNSGTDTNNLGIGVELREGSINISDNIILHNNGGAGLYITGGSNHIISNNIIKLNRNFGAFLEQCDDIVIHDNIISENSLGGLGVAASRGIQIYNNMVDGNYLFGILVIFCDSSVISYNNFSHNIPFGLMVGNFYGSHVTITKNNFLYNFASFAVYLELGGLKQGLAVQTHSNRLAEKLENILNNLNYDTTTIKPASKGFISGCTWDANYWYDNLGTLPEPIRGYLYPFKDIHIFLLWLNFDWHPAEEPYEI